MAFLTHSHWQRELTRKSIHIGLGLFFSIVLSLTSIYIFQWFLTGILLMGLVLAVLAHVRVFPVLEDLLTQVHRPKELFPGESAFVFVLGVLLPTFFFSNPIILIAGILAVTFQDGFSTLVGIKYGKTPILPGKSLEGSLAGFVACFIALCAVIPAEDAAALAMVATLVELIPFNDSFSIPFVTSWVARFLL